MNKQEYISYKIKKLEKEGRGRSHAQIVAIALSMASKKYQAGGGIYNVPEAGPTYGDSFPNGPFGYQPTPNFNTFAPTSPNMNPDLGSYNPNIPNFRPQMNTQPQISIDFGSYMPQPSQNTQESPYSTAEGNQITEYQNPPQADITPQDPNNTNTTVNQSYLNPYTGVNLETALFSLGQSVGYKGPHNTANTVRGVASAGKILLGGARSILSGAGYQNTNQNTQNEWINKLYNAAPTYQYQEGGTITNAQMMTGAFLPDMGQMGVNIEDGEHVQDGETGEIKEAVGEKHDNGGINVALPNNSKVLSDHTKIGAQKAKYFKDKYGIRTKANDTYATVLDKVNKKIGWDDLISKEEDTIEKVGDQQENKIQADTKDINMNFLSGKLQDIAQEKKDLQEIQKAAFDDIFEEQEDNKSKKEESDKMQEGGMVAPQYDDNIMALSQQYNLPPERIVELIQQNVPQMAEGGTTPPPVDPYYFPNSYALPDYGNQPFGSTNYLAGNVATPEEAQARLLQGTNLYPYLLNDSGLVGTDKTVNLNPENILNFQKGYNTLTSSVIAASALNPNLTPEQRQHIITQAREQSFVENGGVKGFDSKYGNYTSSRGGFAMPYLSAEDRAKYPNIKFIGDVVDEKGQLKPEYSDLSNADLIKNTVATAGNGALNIGLLDIPQTTQENATVDVQPQQNQTVTQYSNANLPVDFLLPPSPADPVYKSAVSLNRIDPTKISAEPNLIESSRQLQATTDALSALPDGERAAAIASIQGQIQTANNQAISGAEQFNAQSAAQAQQYNAQAGDKQQLLNEQFAQDYQNKALGAKMNTERDLRSYFQDLNLRQRQNYADVRDLNLLNQLYPNFQTNGEQVTFKDDGGKFYNSSNILTADYNRLDASGKKAYEAEYGKKLAQEKFKKTKK